MILSKNPWKKGFPKSGIQTDEIHVWRWPIDISDSQVEDFWRMLSPNEREKAGKFFFEKDRMRFIAARGTLRHILGLYLNENPGQIQFDYTAFGKPLLKSDSNLKKYYFNLSHSENLALFAITGNGSIGIDIEYIRYDVDIESIISRFFSEREILMIQRYIGEKQQEVFFQFWTRKEAFLKATGKGLSFPLENCDVSLVEESKFSQVIIPKESEGEFTLYVKDLEAGSGYKAAIVAGNPDCMLSYWDFDLQ
jgi:4'-phosphopantetheinyl transferase